jgi:hypothetical protein
MGKTRNTGKLATQIQFDNSNNLVIGTSASSSFNTSGSVNAIGGITGSIFGIGNPTSFSASISSNLVSIQSVTASNIARLSNLETKSSSIDISVSSINTFTSSNSNTSLNLLTSSLATTGSNSFFGTQVFSGSVYIANDLIVQGSSSIQYISASSVSIGTNIVQLNTATPSVRFAGLSVQDSGSSAGVTGSILWDSLCNRWIYSNPSTIGYSGGMLMSGPRTSTLGTESPLTCNYIAKSGGGDHLYDSCIIDDGTTVCVNANLVASGTMRGTTIYGSNVVCSTVGKFTTCIDAGSATFSNSVGIGTTLSVTGATSLSCRLSIGASDQSYASIFVGGALTTGTNQYAIITDPQLSGTGDNYAVFANARIKANTAVTNTFGVYIPSAEKLSGATITNNYALYIANQTSGTTLNYSIYSSGGTNYFGGCVGIGISTPDHKLHVFSNSAQEGIKIDATLYPEIVFSRGGCIKGYLAIAGSAGGYGAGTLVDSLILRSENAIHLSPNAGGIALTLASAGIACFSSTVCAPTLRATGAVIGGYFVTDSGTAAIPYNSYATFYTVQNYQNAIYLVTLQLNGYSNYTAFATIIQNDSSLQIANSLSNVAAIQVSGLNIQGTNGSGITQSMPYKIIRIG